MSDATATTYQVFKDFAGHVAIIIGAGVAACITFVISEGQKRIAQSQCDIALDQLKFNLLQKRYEIYQATKELLECGTATAIRGRVAVCVKLLADQR